MKSYQHIFFDLDHTLWDYEANAGQALAELYMKYNFGRFEAFSPEELANSFFRVNDDLWDDYNHGRIQREDIRLRRFPSVFESLNVSVKEIPPGLEDEYIALSPTKTNTFEGAHEVLEYMNERYEVHLITNGFDDIQTTKMTSAGIIHHFDVIITSETAGYRKPDPRIFELALQRAGAEKHHSIMIGDNLKADIGGARDYGLDTVFFNPQEVKHTDEVTHEIKRLHELMELL